MKFVWDRVKALEGQRLKTLHRGKPFLVTAVDHERVWVLPEVGRGQERSIGRAKIERLVELDLSPRELRARAAVEFPASRVTSYIAAIALTVNPTASDPAPFIKPPTATGGVEVPAAKKSNPRLNTRLESEGAEFLVLGQLLLERILAYKTYSNMPGYDLVATNPDRNTAARIQVKSRWRTGAPGFPIRNLDCDFVVFARLNRGSKDGRADQKAPEYFVFPIALVANTPRSVRWGKILLRNIPQVDTYRERWDLIRSFLEHGESTLLA